MQPTESGNTCRWLADNQSRDPMNELLRNQSLLDDLQEKFKNVLDEFVTNPDKSTIENELKMVSGDVNGMKQELVRMLNSASVLR